MSTNNKPLRAAWGVLLVLTNEFHVEQNYHNFFLEYAGELRIIVLIVEELKEKTDHNPPL